MAVAYILHYFTEFGNRGQLRKRWLISYHSTDFLQRNAIKYTN